MGEHVFVYVVGVLMVQTILSRYVYLFSSCPSHLPSFALRSISFLIPTQVSWT